MAYPPLFLKFTKIRWGSRSTTKMTVEIERPLPLKLAHNRAYLRAVVSSSYG